MKIQIIFKSPDSVFYALRDLSEDERIECEELLSKWIKYGEQITVEIDTDTDTAKVLEV